MLKLRCVVQIVQGKPTAWVQMANELIHKELRKGPFKWERQGWRPCEALLLNVKLHTTLRTGNNILNNREEVTCNLCFDNHLDVILGRLSIHQLFDLMYREGEPHESRR